MDATDELLPPTPPSCGKPVPSPAPASDSFDARCPCDFQGTAVPAVASTSQWWPRRLLPGARPLHSSPTQQSSTALPPAPATPRPTIPSVPLAPCFLSVSSKRVAMALATSPHGTAPPDAAPAVSSLDSLGHSSISLVPGKCSMKCSTRTAAARHLSVHAQAATWHLPKRSGVFPKGSGNGCGKHYSHCRHGGR